VNVARRAWLGLEAVHGVVYFAPEAAAAFKDLGLKGFWMGYFASRAAPLGPVPADVVEATFFGFAPAMVRRSIPDAWSYSSPADVLAARADAAGAALGRLLGDTDVTEAAILARGAAEAADIAGRPLFAAHRTLPWPEAPMRVLWHAATLLREHRGDGHVAACVVEGLDGLDAHVLQHIEGGVPRETLQPNRGWSDAEWEASEARLRARGELRALKASIEDRTDELAGRPLRAVDAERLCALLAPLRRIILDRDGIPVPNPMGLPGDRDAVRGFPR
jgi:hypothetical protein